jgi:hypothetical protein
MVSRAMCDVWSAEGRIKLSVIATPFLPLRSGPKAASKPSRLKRIPSSQLMLLGIEKYIIIK